MLKVVIDTSVFIAALLSPRSDSSPRKILKLWREGYFSLVVAPPLLHELVTRLIRRGVSSSDMEDLLYEATYLNDIDPDDNKFLAAAYEAQEVGWASPTERRSV